MTLYVAYQYQTIDGYATASAYVTVAYKQIGQKEMGDIAKWIAESRGISANLVILNIIPLPIKVTP